MKLSLFFYFKCKNYQKAFYSGLLTWALATIVFGFAYKIVLPADFFGHYTFFLEAKEQGFFLFPPLYYLAFSNLYKLLPFFHILVSSSILLGLAIAFKFFSGYFFLVKELNLKELRSPLIILIPFLLLIFTPITALSYEGSNWFLGKYTPTVWHNPTLIFVFPFCILLFYFSLKWLETKQNKYWWYQLGLGIVILLSKPSFLFVFVPAIPIVAFFKAKFQITSLFIKTSFLSVVLASCIGLEYLIIFGKTSHELPIYRYPDVAGVSVGFFVVYKAFTEYAWWDWISSFAFPILAVALYPRILLQNYRVWYGILLIFGSLFVFFIFIELPPRTFDGNFYWQIPICMYLLILVICSVLLENRHLLDSKKNVFLVIVFSLHSISGILYLIRWFTEYNYY
jgi:hypothetical protein